MAAIADLVEDAAIVSVGLGHLEPEMVVPVAAVKWALLIVAVVGAFRANANEPEEWTSPGIYRSLAEDPGMGVSLSGGGIRSAAFSLGAIQALQDKKLLDRVRLITAVSGGSYIAAARAITLSMNSSTASLEPPAFAHGTPEETWLRFHTRYMIPNARGGEQAFSRWFRGMSLTLLVVFAGLVLATRAVGWPVHYLLCQPDDCAQPPLVPAMASALFVLALIVASVPLVRRLPTDNMRRSWFATADLIVMATVGIAGLYLLIPTWPSVVNALVSAWRWFLNVLPGSLPKVATDDASLITWLWGAVSALGIGAALRSFLVPRITKNADLIVAFLFAVSSAFLIVVFVDQAARAGPVGEVKVLSWLIHEWQLVAICIPIFLGALFVEAASWSLHPFYKSRLATAFSLVRKHDQAEPIDPTQLPPLFVAREVAPPLVIQAAANVASEEAPPGRRARSFIFSRAATGMPPQAGSIAAYADNESLKAVMANRLEDLSYMAAASISGAAFSPAMGRFTLRSLQGVGTLLNLRLGVWLPNPKRIKQNEKQAWRTPRVVPHMFRELLGLHSVNSRYLYVTDGGHWENLGLVELLRRGHSPIFCFDAGGDAYDTFSEIAQSVRLAAVEYGITLEDFHPELVLAPLEEGDGSKKGRKLSRRSHTCGKIRWPDGTEGTLWYCKLAVTPESPVDVQEYQRRHSEFPNHSTLKQLFDELTFDAYKSLGHWAATRMLDDCQSQRSVGAIPQKDPH